MIICTGESLIDFVPLRQSDTSGLPEYQPVPGGSPYNCCLAAARLEGDVAFIGAISTDFFGQEIYGRLVATGVRTGMVTRVENPTTLAFVKKAADGSASYAFYTNGAADRALTPDLLPETLPDGALLQVGSISLIPDPEGSTILGLIEREAGARVIVLDPNIRTSLIDDEVDFRDRLIRAFRSATIVKTSDEDLAWIYPGVDSQVASQRVLEAGVQAVVLTRGSRGSAVYTGTHSIEIPAIPVDVVDTIGAGDSFMAALLVWLDEHQIVTPAQVTQMPQDAWQSVLRFAGQVAAITCTRSGADTPLRSDLLPA